MKIKIRNYAYYKLANSLFAGLSIGAVFTIYSPLEPSIFSLGGVLLAVGLLLIARLYGMLIKIERFFIISLTIEIVMLLMVVYYLLSVSSYTTALIIYLGYQFTFVFGSYLIRAETLFIKKAPLLGFVDIYKQIGYLAGLAISWVFFQLLKSQQIVSNIDQIYYLHYILLITQISIIILMIKAFSR